MDFQEIKGRGFFLLQLCLPITEALEMPGEMCPLDTGGVAQLLSLSSFRDEEEGGRQGDKCIGLQ
jgi:hypothetical protein